jgi:hypothetical protein
LFCHRFFVNKFPGILNGDVNKEIDVLQSQFCSFQFEDVEEIEKEERIDVQWSLVGKMRSAFGNLAYDTLSVVMLAVLMILYSSAECQRIFSQVTKT